LKGNLIFSGKRQIKLGDNFLRGMKDKSSKAAMPKVVLKR